MYMYTIPISYTNACEEYLDWSGKTLAVLCYELDDVLHASSIAGIETVAIGCLPGFCLHHEG